MTPTNETAIVLPELEKNDETSIVGFQNLADVRAAYLQFPMKMSKSWGPLKAEYPDLSEYEPVVVTPNVFGEKTERVGPVNNRMSFDCFYLSGYQCFTDMSIENGQIITSCLDPKIGRENKLVEHCEGALLVFDSEKTKLLPVRGSFRKAMSQIIKNMENFLNAVKKVDDPQTMKDWYLKSEDHKATAQFPPNYRGICHVDIFTMPTREDPQKKYPTARIRFVPNSVKHVAMLQNLMQTEDFPKAMRAVAASYTFRNKEIAAARCDK